MPIKPETAPWSKVRERYRFVDELANLRDSVKGAGNLERFDYWLNTYRAMASMAEAACLRGELDKATPDQVSALRTELARVWEKMLGFEIAAASTPGEFGTIANLEQHNRKRLHFLEAYGEAPALSDVYSGPARIIVPTVRTLLANGEAFRLKIIALDREPVKCVDLYWRPMGKGRFRMIVADPVGRAVYSVNLPPAASDMEYYIRVETSQGKELFWPPTAPSLNQTVICWTSA